MLLKKATFLEGQQKQLPTDETSIRDLLIRILENQEQNGNRVCASYDVDTLKIDQLVEGANRVATAVVSHKLVAICMQPSLELIITLCGIILSGIPYVPIEPTLPYERIEYILSDSKASLVVCDNCLSVFKDFDGLKCLLYSDIPHYSNSIQYKASKIDSDDIFCLMYTSGSTGQPKGVRLPHRALLNRLHWQWSQFPFSDNEVCCLKTSISFADSIAEIFAPLLYRIPISVVPKSSLLNINELISIMSYQKITRITVVPSLLVIFLEYIQSKKKKLTDLRIITCSGDTLSIVIIELFFSLKDDFLPNCRLINLYGSTEVMADVTCEVFDSSNNLHDTLSMNNRISIGSPIYNTRVYIIDPDECGIGELVVEGANIANGYHNIQEDNKDLLNKFIAGTDGKLLFCTGDRGTIYKDRIILFGRNDSQVKIAGNRVDLSEIELVIKRHCNCYQPIVLFEKTKGEIIVFIKSTEQVINLDRISLAKYLPLYAVPSQFIIVSEFPLLVSGKIDKEKLLNSLDDIQDTKIKHESIESPKQNAFLIALDKIGIPLANLDQSFFAAGGSSLTALTLVANLHRIGFHNLTVERLLNANCLRDILVQQHEERQCPDEIFFESQVSYQIIPLEKVNKEEAIRIICESFSKYSEIDVVIDYNLPELIEKADHEFMLELDKHWETFITAGLSFCIIDEIDQILGVSLSFNATHDIQFFRNMESLEAPFNMMIHAGEAEMLRCLNTHNISSDSVMNNFITIVNPNIDPGKRLMMMYYIERETIRVAKEHEFKAILVTNTSSLTQQLAEYVFNYDEHLVIYPSRWKDGTGNLVFPHANSNLKMTISAKYII